MDETVTDRLTKAEASLLLFLETAVVDHRGRVDMSRMNAEDDTLVKSFVKRGIIEFGRIVSTDHFSGSGMRAGTNWVKFSDSAWIVTARLRRERGERGWTNRLYARTCGETTKTTS